MLGWAYTCYTVRTTRLADKVYHRVDKLTIWTPVCLTNCSSDMFKVFYTWNGVSATSQTVRKSGSRTRSTSIFTTLTYIAWITPEAKRTVDKTSVVEEVKIDSSCRKSTGEAVDWICLASQAIKTTKKTRMSSIMLVLITRTTRITKSCSIIQIISCTSIVYARLTARITKSRACSTSYRACSALKICQVAKFVTRTLVCAWISL